MYQSSTAGTEFTKSHEGFVSRAYKDQGGVVTIGFGFTNLSRVCKAWFMKTYGRPLQMGDKMVVADAVALLNAVLSAEVAPNVNVLQPDSQEAFDAEADVLYNCGPGAAKWKWAQAAKAQQYRTAAGLLRSTAVTASGKPSVGLVSRRADEARLLSEHAYAVLGSVPAAVSTAPQDVMEIQRNLKTLGYYKGDANGQMDDLTTGALKNFQRAYGLKVDGVPGTATRSALARALASKLGDKVSLGAGGGLGVGGLGLHQYITMLHLDNPLVLVAVAVGVVALVYAGFVIWNHRGVIMGKRTPA